jgi:hypothetical protein
VTRKRILWLVLPALVIAAALLLGANAVYVQRDRAYLLGLSNLAHPDASGRYDLARLGYNAAPVAAAKRAGAFRILVIGDSFMHGITRADYTPSAYLQRRLTELLPGRDIEVVNLGVPSVSFPEYMAIYRFWSRRLEHDAVIFNIFTGNDFTDIGVSAPHSILGDELARRDDIMVSSQSLARRPHWIALPLYYDLYTWFVPPGRPDSMGEPLPHDARYYADSQFDEISYLRIMEIAARPYRPGAQAALALGYDWAGRFLGFAGQVMATGKHVLVSIAPSHVAHAAEWQRRVVESFPQDGPIDPLLPGRRLRAAYEVGGWHFPLLDLTPGMQAAEEGGISTFRGRDSHWSAEGNEAAAALIAAEMMRRWFGG